MNSHQQAAPLATSAITFSESMLRVVSLCCVRDERLLFENLNFSLKSGTALQIVGANGAGKTSLLRILAGLLLQENGQVFWADDDVAKNRFVFNQQLLFLGHKSGVSPRLDCRENLQSWASSRSLNLSIQEIDLALAKVGLASYENEMAAYLSAGQQRRIALARLFLPCGQVWLLDEPFTAIDQDGIAVLQDQMSAHIACGGIIVVTSHQPVVLDAEVSQLTLRGY